MRSRQIPISPLATHAMTAKPQPASPEYLGWDGLGWERLCLECRPINASLGQIVFCPRNLENRPFNYLGGRRGHSLAGWLTG